MSENTTLTQCTDAEFTLARTSGLLIVTTSDEVAVHKFAALIRAETRAAMAACPKCDECSPYLKEGETPAQRIERERRDVTACLRIIQIERTLTDIDRLVDRFLAWPLPSSVCPDGCVMNRDYPHRIGTHLLTAEEAKAMFIHALGRDAALARVGGAA